MNKRHLFVAFFTSLAAAFTLAGYEFIRSISNTLFKQTYGAENLVVVMALVPMAVWVMLSIYGRILSRLGPRKTLMVTTLLSIASILGLFFVIRSGFQPATGLLYLFREAYIVLLIEQYWSFINSSLGEESAKKLNGPICGFASFGSIAGGILLYQFTESFGTLNMLLFAATFTLPAAFISDFAYARIGKTTDYGLWTMDHGQTAKKKDYLGLKEFKLHPMLVFLFLIVITTQVVSATLDIRFQGILQTEIPDPDKQTAFSGGFFAWLNGIAAFLQFIAAPIALRFLPLKLVYLLIPSIHIAASLFLTIDPTLTSAGAAYLLFKVFDYSLFRASKEILYIPFSFDVRYRAKEVIDTFGYRFGKGATSFILVLFQRAGFILTNAYSLIALAGSLVWFGLVFPLFRNKN